ncbi:putative histone-lysine N-methyltransferase PRDM6 [Ptychodera flava]|uniref:putative histone-lysine N-methyltransferase PRDM6 n=1 Tax=Ptychodera flava TaxID=63121 RepID=UPI003969C0DD
MAFQRVGSTEVGPVSAHPYQNVDARRLALGGKIKGQYPMNNNVYVMSFSYEDLYHCLYGYNKMRPILLPSKSGHEETPDSGESWCDLCRESHMGECPMHGPLHSLRKLVNGNPAGSLAHAHLQQSLTHLPEEVSLCTSSLPGAMHGVCAKQRIPIGTWLGPFVGEKVSIEETKNMANTDHLWEIYNEDGEVERFVNGAVEKKESWMHYIRCARSRREQNLCVVQFKGEIYYRVCREISKGAELFVWYDDRYAQFMGIPISLKMKDKDGIPYDEKSPKKIHLGSTPSILGQYIGGTPDKGFLRRERSETHDGTLDIKMECSNLDGACSPMSESSLSPDSNVLNVKSTMVPSTTTSNHAPGNQLDWNMWRCGQCFKTFTQRIMLQMHICPKNPDKPYQCGHCSQSFSQASELRNHVVTHSNERPFKCGFCGRAFAGATTLNNHIRTHTGEKPFRCDKCDRSFTQASQLSRHQRTPGECAPRSQSTNLDNRRKSSGSSNNNNSINNNADSNPNINNNNENQQFVTQSEYKQAQHRQKVEEDQLEREADDEDEQLEIEKKMTESAIVTLCSLLGVQVYISRRKWTGVI